MPAEAIGNLTAHAIARQIKSRAREIGFDLVGIASAEPSRHRAHFRQWLETGQAGSMNYLANRFEERMDPATYFPGAASAVCVAINYHVPLAPPEARAESGQVQGRIARYALGDDYHDIIKDRLFTLADAIRELSPGAQTRCGVDTAPIMERELAARAGIGWVGKNTCVIHPRIGSWLLLGEVLTTLALPTDGPISDHCGACTRCIDACPTHAITEPYMLDARRCISYQTIENRGAVPVELQGGVGDWLYGCDICQEVCPHNRQAPAAIDPSLQPRFPSGTIDADEVLGWTSEKYQTTLRKSAMKRVKLPILQRNAAAVKQNRSDVFQRAKD